MPRSSTQPAGSPTPVQQVPRSQPARRLLVRGNTKLGDSIGAFSLPHADLASCPGSTNLCRSACYVTRYVRLYRIDYTKNKVSAERNDFVSKMSREARLYRIVRVHVAGDFYSADYVRKWIQIAKATPGTVFYAYTRSWRGTNSKMLEALVELSKLPNFVLNISLDKETGFPRWLLGAFGGWGRMTYMATDDRDIVRDDQGQPERALIVFRTKRTTVMAKSAGSTVCPAENGIPNDVTCDRCQLCFKSKLNQPPAPAQQPIQAVFDEAELEDRIDELLGLRAQMGLPSLTPTQLVTLVAREIRELAAEHVAAQQQPA